MRSRNYKEIEKKLKIRFKHRTVLKNALTHSSSVSDPRASNEVLEFLGDAVLELVAREYLWKKFPDAREGELSERKKHFTSAEVLARVGSALGIGRYVFMSKGEKASGGQTRPSLIADTLEALIGGLYIDRGLSYTSKFIARILLTKTRKLSKDHKSILNHWAMKQRRRVVYRIARETGPPHERTFHVHLFIDNKKKVVGIGRSRKDAEQHAAAKFLRKYAKRYPASPDVIR